MSMYSVFVGNYESPSATKSDAIKLNKLGLKAFVFSRNDHYALKVFSSPHKEDVMTLGGKLEKLGFVIEYDELKLGQ